MIVNIHRGATLHAMIPVPLHPLKTRHVSLTVTTTATTTSRMTATTTSTSLPLEQWRTLQPRVSAAMIPVQPLAQIPHWYVYGCVLGHHMCCVLVIPQTHWTLCCILSESLMSRHSLIVHIRRGARLCAMILVPRLT